MAYRYPQPGAGPYGAPGPYGAYWDPVPFFYGAPVPLYGAPAGMFAPPGMQMQFQPQVQFGAVPVSSQQPRTPYPVSFSQKYFFFIRSRLNGLVLDVEGANPAPGTSVILWNQKNSYNNNQLWSADCSTGTIRSKLNAFCLEVSGNKVVLNPYQYANPNQRFEPIANVFRNKYNKNVTLGWVRHRIDDSLTVDASGGSGARLVVGKSKKDNTPQFEFQFTSPPQNVVRASVRPPIIRHRFRIVSEMNCKVLDVRGENPCSGTDVIMYPKKAGFHKNQLWYFDCQGIIRSGLNDMALDSGVGGQKVKVMPYTGDVRQQWTLVGNKITNPTQECLDIRGESNRDGAEVISYKYKGSANQHWRIETIEYE